MYTEKYIVSITTIADGSGVGYTPVINGRILNIIYTKDAASPYADTVDFTITGEDSGINCWTEANVTASKTVAPRQATHSTAGVAALYAAGGAAVNDFVYLANERVKISIASGGDSKVGSFMVIVG